MLGSGRKYLGMCRFDGGSGGWRGPASSLSCFLVLDFNLNAALSDGTGSWGSMFLDDTVARAATVEGVVRK